MITENWKEEFDKKFGYSSEEETKEYIEADFDKTKLASAGCDDCLYNHFWRAEIKEYISTLLSKERNKVLDEVIEKLPKRQLIETEDGRGFITYEQQIINYLKNLKD